MRPMFTPRIKRFTWTAQGVSWARFAQPGITLIIADPAGIACRPPMRGARNVAPDADRYPVERRSL